MRHSSLLAALLAASVVAFVGCSDITSPTGPHDSSPIYTESSPAKWDNNPDNGNVRINREPERLAVSWTDEKTGLRATHTAWPLAEDPTEFDCGLLEPIDPIAHQDVGLLDPDDPFSSRLHHIFAGELWIIVRDTNQPGDCFGGTLIAEGLGRFHGTDNDIFGSLDPNNRSTWGFSGHGLLNTPDGGTVRYNGHVKFQYGLDRNDEFYFRTMTAQVVTN